MRRGDFRRPALWAAGIIGSIALLALLLFAAFPIGWLKPTLERRLASRYDAPVTITRIERRVLFSLTPEIEVQGLTIGQPAWAGPGHFITLRSARLRIPFLPLLRGQFHPELIRLSGLALDLVRTADGRKNWTHGDRQGGAEFSLQDVAIEDSRIRYRDGKQMRRFDATISADPARGLRVSGTGIVRGSAVTLSADGGSTRTEGRPWPFRFRIAGKELVFTGQGTMERPLDMTRMTADMRARGSDLKMLDAVIEAGLFGTQPIDLSAHVRHDAPDWTITALTGTIGRSHITGRLSVRRHDGRTLLDGDLAGGPFSFDDLASDAGIANARSVERRIGERVLPGTRIALDKLGRTDGTIRFRFDTLTGSASPPFTSAQGTLTLDHSLLLLKPLRFGLDRGSIGGAVIVDQRDRPLPLMTADLTLRGATLSALARTSPVDSGVQGRLHLAGSGRTIREAIGRSSGTIGIAARDGNLPARLASLLGFDVGRGITTDEDRQARLNCAVLRLAVHGGLGTVDPLIVDTSRGQTQGRGTASLASEEIAIRLTGAPKKDSLLRLPGAAMLRGTLSAPRLDVPVADKSAGSLLKMLGRAIADKQGPLAADIDCAALTSHALAMR